MFLDVKSAYPSVHRKRLIHVLERKTCPPYLCYIIDSFLFDRTTSLKFDDFVSQIFSVPNGLPQRSPLSVTLYLIYNSSLLLPNPPSLNTNDLSIAYIDNVTHLLAVDNVQQGRNRAEEVMARSKNCGARYRAIFDDKKTNLMIFTRKQQPLHKIEIAHSTYTLQKESSITLPKKNTPGKYLTNKIFNNFQLWSQCFPIKLYWCPGHTGIQQNEEVDTLAKEAASSTTISYYTLHHISTSKLKQTTNHNSRTPPILSDTEMSRVKFRTLPKIIIQELNQLEKGLASTIQQLRSDHSPLNAYLYQIKQIPSPRCENCNTQETTSHYLL
ncbi:hypothetical protein O181_042952 [Austropuccinia psidii MF-1]|uniref:Reverse transcriptase domain-containing protein n=1 Tax=Austropuccinia psidii MF-1 TaxID=1389203 RepID=A0A9Q3DNU7_9BASI|nr:hypothetical protein [Austropuccinia psidii MF-1]